MGKSLDCFKRFISSNGEIIQKYKRTLGLAVLFLCFKGEQRIKILKEDAFYRLAVHACCEDELCRDFYISFITILVKFVTVTRGH